MHKIRLDDRRAKQRPRRLSNLARPSSCVPLVGRFTSQTFRTNGMATHTYTHRLGGRAVSIYFVHHAEVIRCEHKMVHYFHVRRIQNLLQMIMVQGLPAWAEEGMFSRATGVVWLILILVQNDRERKKQKQKQNKTKNTSVLAPPGLCRGLPFRDVPMTQKRPQVLKVYRRSR